MYEYAKRIRELRKLAGKSEKEMALLLNISEMAYLDIELYDDEIFDCLTLTQVNNLSKIFNKTLFEMIVPSDYITKIGNQVSFFDLVVKIKKYIKNNKIKIDEFENMVGWNLKEFIENPNWAWEQPIMFLQDICNMLEINWIDTIPHDKPGRMGKSESLPPTFP